MTLSIARSRAVFRACVVSAVREGELLMEQLIMYTLDALSKLESETRVIAKRDLASEALRLLRQHQAGLIKAYPMALLEMFADGPAAPAAKAASSTPLDFGELSLVDDDEVQAQVELSRAQQMALHTTEEVLAELNGLVSSAQGLPRVQPERNPLRPENYIRALQRVVADTQVIAPIREAWMQHMRELLGQQLVDVYKRAAKGLREHGIEQVGWGTRAGVPADYPPSHQGGGWAASMHGPAGGSGWAPGVPSGYVPSSHAPMAPQVEEALLTVGFLRQMLSGGGDPYQELQAISGTAYGAQPSSQAPMRPSVGAGPAYGQVGVGDAMEDIAQLERLVGRLANSQPAYLHSGQGAVRSHPGALYGPSESAPMGAEVVARMVENISQDSRLLPPVQKAVQDLEPAIRKLIRHDPRFFSDANHPARRLLDELTQRSLAYSHVEAPGFSRFMRLVDQAVSHLARVEITSAAPFETVRRALQAAWEAQQKKMLARQEREQYALMLAEEREMRAERIAEEVAALPEMEGAPQDIADFVLGPWVEAAAGLPADGQGTLGREAREAIDLAALLLWSVQPARTVHDPDRLDEAAVLLPVRLRSTLETANRPTDEIERLLQRVGELHQDAMLARPPDIELPDDGQEPEQAQAFPQTGSDGESASQGAAAVEPVPPEPAEGLAPAAGPAPEPQSDGFVIGAWVDLSSSGRRLRTQLTWCSPHNTLFLFTAPDGSTQSMTRRMRDKLVAEGALKLVPVQSVVGQAIDHLVQSARGAATTPKR
jgi:hypothetical protein